MELGTLAMTCSDGRRPSFQCKQFLNPNTGGEARRLRGELQLQDELENEPGRGSTAAGKERTVTGWAQVGSALSLERMHPRQPWTHVGQIGLVSKFSAGP